MPPGTTVAIVARTLPHYRVPFFRALRAALEPAIDLRLDFGRELPGTVPRTVDFAAPWAHAIENRYVPLGGSELVWQGCWRALRGADLVIVEHAGRLLLNYALLAEHALRPRRGLAFWGHGRNWQAASRRSLVERIKRLTAARVDWWFAYTAMSAAAVRGDGVPDDRITIVDNSIDTTELAAAHAAVTATELARLRVDLRLAPDARIGLYCGGLDASKQLPFLLDAAREIRRREPRFELVIVGDGPKRAALERAREPYVHVVGAVFGPARAPYFALAEAVLMPAPVGLVIVDSFVTATPLFAADHATHGPEIAYLQPGHNGALTPFDAVAYAAAVAAYLHDPALQRRLRSGCAESARTYTLAHMVERFASGVRACLARRDGPTSE